jgi:NAD(P)-dependent dehydrogenase (short-subunit alcohol dehydrogenase family)
MIIADLASLSQTRSMAETLNTKLDRLDVLINNAGVFMNDFQKSEEGFEMTFAVNHLAHFLLTLALLSLLEKSAPSRIINVSSIAHQGGGIDFDTLNSPQYFDGYRSYCLSKLANILFTRQLVVELEGTGITANSLHPGVVTTKLLWAGFNIEGVGLEEGAETTVYCASSPELEDVSGEYFIKCKPTSPSKQACDDEAARELWNKSLEMVGL